MKKGILTSVLFLSMTFTNIAFADGWPASVVGNWSVNGNGGFPGTLSITSESSDGMCRAITGTIYATDPIEGFYCPQSGRIHFIRKTVSDNNTIQTWTGNLYYEWFNGMGGTFAAVNSDGGSLGEYGWFAWRE